MVNNILAYLAKAILGAILGVFTLGTVLSFFYGAEMWVGVTSAVIGTVVYYAYLIYKGETD